MGGYSTVLGTVAMSGVTNNRVKNMLHVATKLVFSASVWREL
jgi:hypothetical protein